MVQPSDALEEAVRRNRQLAVLKREVERVRALRLEALRAATETVPVVDIAARLGMTRQRVYKILKG